MRTNHVKQKLRAGQPVIGTWLAIGNPHVAETLAHVGFDWLVVDAEHNPIDIQTLAAMFAVVSPTSTAPMVRVPWGTAENLKRVLDAGAWGVVAPMVNDRAEAEAVVEACLYPPRGRRSLGGGRHSLSFGTDPLTYFHRANDELLLIMQIESAEGVENVEEIVQVPGVDAVFIGPQDLCANLGIPPQPEPTDPRFEEAVQRVLQAAKRHGVAPGIHVQTPETARRRIAEGFQFIAVGSDLRFLTARATELLGQIARG
ncbi:MAG TPA: aldolase/citrate lyase family protein [Chloroflexota bacterium]